MHGFHFACLVIIVVATFLRTSNFQSFDLYLHILCSFPGEAGALADITASGTCTGVQGLRFLTQNPQKEYWGQEKG